jgi:hypothetical protein
MKLAGFQKANLMKKTKLEKHINDFIKSYLETTEEFNDLDESEKLYIYSILRKLLNLVYQVLKYPNVYPILLVQNSKSKIIILNAFKEVEHIIPTINNIKVEVVN